jgi:ATP-dependent helicase/nuclease subunit A
VRVQGRLRLSDHLPLRAVVTVLSDEQEQAVARRREPLLLAAGAGSGKTSVLVERFVRAVREDGLAPARILAITFTERAAGELQERVRRRFLELGAREAARDTEAAFVTTFHGFCARLLRAHPLMMGLDPEFAILDESLAGRLRERAFTAALREFLHGEPSERVDLLAAYGPDRIRSMIEGVHAELRSRGQRRPRLPLADRTPSVLARGDSQRYSQEDPGLAACELLDELLDAFGRCYEQLKRARAAVDFDDLELYARELLERSESVRAAWAERFELLMVDEFQDTNPRQLAILRALERENLFTVGDERQAIYGFRHADVTLFRARRAELAERGGSLELARNFRSRPALLDVVNAVFRDRFGGGYAPLIAGREDAGDSVAGEERGERGDRGERGEGGERGEPLVELLLTSRRGWDDGEQALGEGGATPLWRQAEAHMLAGRVAELVRSGAAEPGEIVVLLRAVGDLDVYERALRERGLRTLATAGGFWASQQVGDLLCYLRSLANPLDELAVYSTLASPLVGLSSDGLALLARAARARGSEALWATVQRDTPELLARLPASDGAALVAFRERFERERRTASVHTISQLIERAVHASGYRAHLLARDGGERRLANVHKLLRFARRFEESEGRDLRAFLDHAARLKDSTSAAEPDAPVAAVEPEAVRLMSIHAAKGLEFPVVCVADLGRSPNLSVPDLLVDGDRVGLRLARLDGGDATPSLDFQELSDDRNRAQSEEEDRILYVAMTRARERLLLSGAVDFEHWPAPRPRSPMISWLGPAIAEDLPAIVLALGQSAHHHVRDLAVGSASAAGASGATIVRCRLNAPSKGEAESGGELQAGGNSYEAGGNSYEGGGNSNEGGGNSNEGGGYGCISAQGAPSSIQEVDTIAHNFQNEQLQLAIPSPAPASGHAATPHEPDRVAQAPREPDHAAQAPREPDPLAQVSSLSYTTLSELERCGYRYYLERILGLSETRPQPASGSSRGGLDARARGALVHRLMESVDFACPRAPSPARVAKVARELGLRVARGEREEITALVAVACGGSPDRQGSPALAERLALADSVRREHPFAFALGPREPLLTGVIDLLAREADGCVLIVDYKTDRVGAEADLAALVDRDYDLQRLIYALAALRDGAREVEIVHWFLERPEDWVGASFAAADRHELEERLAGRIHDARARTVSVSEHPHRGLCETCPARARLCSWSEAEMLRDAPVAAGLALTP